VAGPRDLYRWLVRRLPPRAAWALWRVALAATSPRRRRVAGPEVALACIAWEASEDRLDRLMERLVAGLDGDPGRVLVVSDCDAVELAAARGCRFEHLPPRAEWERRFPGADYDAFLRRRAASIRDSYAIARVELEGEAPTPLRGTLAGSHAPPETVEDRTQG
jgi:hypothetical protein